MASRMVCTVAGSVPGPCVGQVEGRRGGRAASTQTRSALLLGWCGMARSRRTPDARSLPYGSSRGWPPTLPRSARPPTANFNIKPFPALCSTAAPPTASFNIKPSSFTPTAAPKQPTHLQEAAVAPEHLLARVLRQLQERVACKDDGAVGQGGVADDKVLLDAFHSRRQVHGHARERLGADLLRGDRVVVWGGAEVEAVCGHTHARTTTGNERRPGGRGARPPQSALSERHKGTHGGSEHEAPRPQTSCWLPPCAWAPREQ